MIVDKTFGDWERQYRNDPMFHRVVTITMQLLETCELTPFEIRNAVNYAMVRFTMIHGTGPIIMKPTPERFETGDIITFHTREHWYLRLWRWLTRYKPPVYVITKVDENTFKFEEPQCE